MLHKDSYPPAFVHSLSTLYSHYRVWSLRIWRYGESTTNRKVNGLIPEVLVPPDLVRSWRKDIKQLQIPNSIPTADHPIKVICSQLHPRYWHACRVRTVQLKVLKVQTHNSDFRDLYVRWPQAFWLKYGLLNAVHAEQRPDPAAAAFLFGSFLCSGC